MHNPEECSIITARKKSKHEAGNTSNLCFSLQLVVADKTCTSTSSRMMKSSRRALTGCAVLLLAGQVPPGRKNETHEKIREDNNPTTNSG